MFKNIGNKIKILAKVTTVLGAVISFINGISMMMVDDDLIFLGFLTIILGPLLSWCGALTIYGFGEVINQLEYSNAYNKKIYQLLNKKESTPTRSAHQNIGDERETQNTGHKWLCGTCGKMINKSPCPYCGKE